MEASREALFHSVLLTPPSDHDYLTRAQAYWSILIDTDTHDAARRFALRLYREAPESMLPEVAEMVRRSYSALEAQVRDKE